MDNEVTKKLRKYYEDKYKPEDGIAIKTIDGWDKESESFEEWLFNQDSIEDEILEYRIAHGGVYFIGKRIVCIDYNFYELQISTSHFINVFGDEVIELNSISVVEQVYEKSVMTTKYVNINSL